MWTSPLGSSASVSLSFAHWNMMMIRIMMMMISIMMMINKDEGCIEVLPWEPRRASRHWGWSWRCSRWSGTRPRASPSSAAPSVPENVDEDYLDHDLLLWLHPYLNGLAEHLEHAHVLVELVTPSGEHPQGAIRELLPDDHDHDGHHHHHCHSNYKTCFEGYAPTLAASHHRRKATRCRCSLDVSCLGTAWDSPWWLCSLATMFIPDIGEHVNWLKSTKDKGVHSEAKFADLVIIIMTMIINVIIMIILPMITCALSTDIFFFPPCSTLILRSRPSGLLKMLSSGNRFCGFWRWQWWFHDDFDFDNDHHHHHLWLDKLLIDNMRGEVKTSTHSQEDHRHLQWVSLKQMISFISKQSWLWQSFWT